MGQWFQAMFSFLRHIPRWLVPGYFDAIVVGAYNTSLDHVFKHMSRFVRSCLTPLSICEPVQWFETQVAHGNCSAFFTGYEIANDMAFIEILTKDENSFGRIPLFPGPGNWG